MTQPACNPFGRRVAAGVAALTVLLTGAAAQSASLPPSAASCLPFALSPLERDAMQQALRVDAGPSTAPRASLDETTTSTLLHFAKVQLGLRVKPSSVDRFWAIEPPVRNLAAELEAARLEGRLAQWLKSLEAPHAEYARLNEERCRYRTIIEAGGWRPLPAGPALKEGDAHPTVAALRARLQAEGYDLAAVEPADVLDAGLAAALRAFQRRHDLEEDGVLGAQTRQALDVPAERRLGQIEANLERWRWLPHVLPEDRLELDIGAAEATLFVAGRPRLSMRAIVGDPKHRTPMFASRVESVLFNPPWNVPSSIARNEIVPKLARDPGYLARHNMVWTPHGLQQRPGPANSLGLLKFDLPSPFGVYLHDTPSRTLFARRVRTLSHGCMRLEKPRELAAELLSQQGWTAADIETSIAAGATRRVALQTSVPLFVVYRTAASDSDGWVSFRRDPYGWDAKLQAALASAEQAGR